MITRSHWADFRILAVIVFSFGACGYEPPLQGSGSTTSSSSSNGMGGAGGQESTSSVSSSGEGGFGGMPTGTGGMGGFGGGNGGGGVPGAEVACVITPCDTSGANLCCVPPMLPTLAYCKSTCTQTDYKLKCDDKADCADQFCCFDMATNTSSCNKACGKYLCKSDGDCPALKPCEMKLGLLDFCAP